jgi:hypothetical protein
MLRTEFMTRISSTEYTELRALSQLESVGLDRLDRHAVAVCRSMGHDVDFSAFQYGAEVKTLNEELAALGGMVKA